MWRGCARKWEDCDVNFRIFKTLNKKKIVWLKWGQTGSLLNKRELNQNAECPLRRDWMKLVLGFKIIENPLDTLHRGHSFQKCQNDLQKDFWNCNHVGQQKVQLCVALFVIFLGVFICDQCIYHNLVISCYSVEHKKIFFMKLLCDWVCYAWCCFLSANPSGLISGSKSLFTWTGS